MILFCADIAPIRFLKFNMTLQHLIIGLFLSLFSVYPVGAIDVQFPAQYEISLPTPTTLANKVLGTTLAVAGNTAAVIALSDTGIGSGTVYLYDAQENWRITMELNSQADTDNFAQSVVLQNNILIVSADHDDENNTDSGAVYVFERNQSSAAQPWRQTAKITAPDGGAGDNFGAAVVYMGDTLYIGAPKQGQGKVYLFSRNTETGQWQWIDSIIPTDPLALRFGTAIAQYKDTLIIGAPYTDANAAELDPKIAPAPPLIRAPRFAISKGDTVDPGIESGAIFVYEHKGKVWQETQKLGASNRETGDHLGEQIAIEGGAIFASVRQKDIFDHLRAGAVYVYKKRDSNWVEDTALFAQKNNVGANFGISFSILDNLLIVGANKVHENGFNSGQAYLYSLESNDSWQTKHLLSNADLEAHDQFGLSVALGQAYVLVASKRAVYAFQDKPIQNLPAFFYPASNIVQLNEIVVPGLGIFRANFYLSQQDNEFVMTLIDSHLRTDIQESEIIYHNSSAPFIIPSLAVQQADGEIALYSVVLQQIDTPELVQFRVVSFNPLEL